MIGRKARKYPSNKRLDEKKKRIDLVEILKKKLENWFNIPYLCTLE